MCNAVCGQAGNALLWAYGSVANSIVGKIASRALDWIKEAGGVKNLIAKPIDLGRQWCNYTGVPLSSSATQVTTFAGHTKLLIGSTEALTKLKNWTKPLPERSIHYATADNNAPDAGIMEKIGKKAAQISDWILSVSDCNDFLRGVGLTNFPKALIKGIKWTANSAGAILSGHGLYEEITKMVNGHIVAVNAARNARNGANIPAGTTVAMQAEDYVLSAIKIVMNISYMIVSALGILALSGVIVPYAMFIQLTALTFANATIIGGYFVKHLTVRPELLAIV